MTTTDFNIATNHGASGLMAAICSGQRKATKSNAKIYIVQYENDIFESSGFFNPVGGNVIATINPDGIVVREETVQ